MAGNLVAEQRRDKNGRLVTRWVSPDKANAGSSKGIPAPSGPSVNRLPACPEGWIDLYHRTSPEALEAISESGTMRTRENTPEAYFPTFSEGGQSEGYGSAVIWIRVPEDEVEIDDEFPDGKEHYRVPLSSITRDRMLPYRG